MKQAGSHYHTTKDTGECVLLKKLLDLLVVFFSNSLLDVIVGPSYKPTEVLADILDKRLDPFFYL